MFYWKGTEQIFYIAGVLIIWGEEALFAIEMTRTHLLLAPRHQKVS